MENKDFEYVLLIAQEKSLSKAAEKLYITQPALSLFLSRLEEHLQVRLFERTRMGLTPTYAGEKYIDFARRSIALNRNFDQELCEIRAERKGQIRIGTSPHIGSIVLPDVLSSFQRRYPNIETVIKEGTSHVLERLIDTNEVDIALMHLPLHCEHAAYKRIGEDRYVMVLSGEHPLAERVYQKPGFKRAFIDPTLARNEQFILAHPQQRVRQISDHILKKAEIIPNIRLETSSVQTALRFAEYGLGITFMPESYISLFNVSAHTLFCYLEDVFEASWTFCLVYPENGELSSPVRFLMEETKRLFGT